MPTHSAQDFTPKKILIPTDFSPSAEAAVEVATELASLLHARIYLLNVIPMLPIVGVPDYPAILFPEQEFLDDARRHASEKLSATVARLTGLGIKAACGVEIGNDVVGNILMVLAREHADFLVLSTHGMSGWRPMVFGSIAEKVIKLAQCPLLLLRSQQQSTPPRVKQEQRFLVGSA